MEQRLNAAYLGPGLIERAAALGIGAVGVGTGVLVAAWGISFLWRYAPTEVALRLANPELRVTQDKPFKLEQPKPQEVEPGEIVPKKNTEAQTPTGEVIRREVTVFSNVKHGPGNVVTGWNYKDGAGRAPISQYCYYSASSGIDQSITRVDIAINRVPVQQISSALVPDLEGALAKCQWWQG
jgi:hypothetical protein